MISYVAEEDRALERKYGSRFYGVIHRINLFQGSIARRPFLPI